MATGNTLIQAALQKLVAIGSGDPPSSQQQSDYLDELNRMLDLWSADMGTICCETLDSLTWASGNASRTIGSGGDLNVSRPLEIISAQYRDASNFDYLIPIVTHREYQELSTKAITTAIPSRLAYNPTFPTGTLSVWPVPSSSFTLRLNSRKPIANLSGSGTVSLPPGWEDAIVNNLAIRLCDYYGIDPSRTLSSNAFTAKAALEKDALQFNMAKMDPYLPGSSNNYNPRAYWNI